MNNLKAKTSHLKVKEIRQHEALTYIANHKFSDLSEKDRTDGIVELWKNYRLFMKDAFHLRGNEKDLITHYEYYTHGKGEFVTCDFNMSFCNLSRSMSQSLGIVTSP